MRIIVLYILFSVCYIVFFKKNYIRILSFLFDITNKLYYKYMCFIELLLLKYKIFDSIEYYFVICFFFLFLFND